MKGSSTESLDSKEAGDFIKMGTLNLPTQLRLSAPVVKEWIVARRQNLRPWSTFASMSNLETPKNFQRLGQRVVKNIDYFQSNYVFTFLGLAIYCIITSPLLLIALAACIGACYVLSVRNTEHKLVIMNHELTMIQQYCLVFICGIPVFWLAGAGSAVFWVLGASWLLIMLHASFYKIENLEMEDSFESPVIQTV